MGSISKTTFYMDYVNPSQQLWDELKAREAELQAQIEYWKKRRDYYGAQAETARGRARLVVDHLLPKVKEQIKQLEAEEMKANERRTTSVSVVDSVARGREWAGWREVAGQGDQERHDSTVGPVAGTSDVDGGVRDQSDRDARQSERQPEQLAPGVRGGGLFVPKDTPNSVSMPGVLPLAIGKRVKVKNSGMTNSMGIAGAYGHVKQLMGPRHPGETLIVLIEFSDFDKWVDAQWLDIQES